MHESLLYFGSKFARKNMLDNHLGTEEVTKKSFWLKNKWVLIGKIFKSLYTSWVPQVINRFQFCLYSFKCLNFVITITCRSQFGPCIFMCFNFVLKVSDLFHHLFGRTIGDWGCQWNKPRNHRSSLLFLIPKGSISH